MVGAAACLLWLQSGLEDMELQQCLFQSFSISTSIHAQQLNCILFGCSGPDAPAVFNCVRTYTPSYSEALNYICL
jgi:hypothetical protein